jgi:uncharacterized protein (TIGR03067 family)
MRTACLSCLLVVLAGTVPAAEKKTDQDLIQGDWVVTRYETRGKEVLEFVKDNAPTTTYKGNKYVFKAKGQDDELGEFTLDSKAKIPTIDYKITEGDHKGKVQKGIYKLDGDTLTICLGPEGVDARPEAFKTSDKKPEFVLFTLKRKK